MYYYYCKSSAGDWEWMQDGPKSGRVVPRGQGTEVAAVVVDDVRDAPTRDVRERRTRAEERLGGKAKSREENYGREIVRWMYH